MMTEMTQRRDKEEMMMKILREKGETMMTMTEIGTTHRGGDAILMTMRMRSEIGLITGGRVKVTMIMIGKEEGEMSGGGVIMKMKTESL